MGRSIHAQVLLEEYIEIRLRSLHEANLSPSGKYTSVA